MQASHCGGFFLGSRAEAQRLWCTGLVAPRHVGVFLDQESNLCLLQWQADSLPLSHQESPLFAVLNIKCHLIFVIWLILIKIQWEEKNQNALRVRENSGMLVILVD